MALTLVDVSLSSFPTSSSSSSSLGPTGTAAIAQKRSHPRFSALSPAMLVTIDGVSRHCLVEDLSSSGALVTGDVHLADGQRVRLLLQLPGRAPFSLSGRVARACSRVNVAHNATVYGLAFDPSPHAHHAAAWSTPASVQHTVHDLASHAAVQTSLSLVVADSAKAAATLVHDLMQIGHKAVAVTTALDAIEWLLDDSSHFDTAFVDARCARDEGGDFLGFLADEYPEMRRVLLHDGGPTQKNQRAEPHAILTTPWELDQLAEVFRPAR